MRLTVGEVYCENLVLAVAALGGSMLETITCYYYYYYHHHHHQTVNLYGSLHVFLKAPKFEWHLSVKNLFKLQELPEVRYEITENNNVSSTNFSCV